MNKHVCGRLVLVLAVGACSDSHESLPHASVADSANTRIVTYDLARIELPVRWVLGEPDVQIGQLDDTPEYAFSRIVDVATATDGSIIVSDAVAGNLRVFDTRGQYLRTIGNRGDGPGEFASAPAIVGLVGDSIFAFDSRASRLSIFSLGGALLETTAFQRDSGRPRSLVRLADGAYLSRARMARGDISAHDPQLILDSILVSRIGSSGAIVDTVGLFADRTRVRSVQARGDRFATREGEPPFVARAFVRSDGSRTLVGRSDIFQLAWLDSSRVTVLRIAGLDDRASRAEIRGYQDSVITAQRDQVDPMTRRLLLDFLPDQLPAFWDVLVGDGGQLWVAMTEFDLSQGLDWLVFSPADSLTGLVRTPPNLRVHRIASDHVLGVVLDSLDVPHIARYPLLPPSID